MPWTPEFIELVQNYRDTDVWHRLHYETFDARVVATPYLFDHREWIMSHAWGMGDRPHWWLWKLLVEQMPSPFKLLEVGVYRGSTLSLVARIAPRVDKWAGIYGVTTLTPTVDASDTYPDSEFGYAADIAEIFNAMAPLSPHPTLFVGRSQDEKVLERSGKHGPYDIIYIDAGHTYDDVWADLNNYRPMVRPGGLLVTDDSAFYSQTPYWKGWESVSRAVRDTVEADSEWVELFGISHVRVFYRGQKAEIA